MVPTKSLNFVAEMGRVMVSEESWLGDELKEFARGSLLARKMARWEGKDLVSKLMTENGISQSEAKMAKRK
jgi:hypothetical protein